MEELTVLNLLENFEQPLKVNGIIFDNGRDAYRYFKGTKREVTIEINWDKPNEVKEEKKAGKIDIPTERIGIEVRQYMIKEPTLQFSFHAERNNGVPMPLMTMEVLEKLDETKGMVKLKLKGLPRQTNKCLRCNRTLTHPVSVEYGIGPECGQHYHLDVNNKVETNRKMIEDITWEGWVIKKAITNKFKIS